MDNIICGDCLTVMATMEPNSVDAIVTDPPYGLEFMGKEWDRLWNKHDGDETRSEGRVARKFQTATPQHKAGLDAQEWHYAWAVEALRVAKPGAHLLAFGGTRTFHRLACAIEDAGWEIRDTLMWVYGSGFPKSHDVSKAIDRAAGVKRDVVAVVKKKPSASSDCNEGWVRPWAEGKTTMDITAPATDAARQWDGWGTALKPAWEPIILARKPLDGTVAANVQKWGTGAINVDGCRVEAFGEKTGGNGYIGLQQSKGWNPNNMPYKREQEQSITKGRWPANLIHDGSEEVLELFPESSPPCGSAKKHNSKPGGVTYGQRLTPLAESNAAYVGDSGSAARFFYCAKASRAEREMGCEGMEQKPSYMVENGSKTAGAANGVRYERHTTNANHHPTVKPLALMRYLCRLVTPPNGLILDPFMGSGTTGMAANLEDFRFIGIDKEPEYVAIAKHRIATTHTP
jgi:DNA modification methylase